MTTYTRDYLLNQPTTVADILRTLFDLEVLDVNDVDDHETIDLMLLALAPSSIQLPLPLALVA